MKFTVIDTVWVADDYDTGELICATHTFEEMIDILCNKGFLYDEFEIHPEEDSSEWIPIKEVFGDNWKNVIKRMSAARLARFLDWEINMSLLDIMEVEYDTP